MIHDDFATYDAAYVLGALSPADRRAYEQHLTECDICSRAVRDLAGMPGLLGSVPLSAVDTPVGDEPVPDMLPRLLRKVGRDRRVRSWWLSGVTAAAAALVLVLSLALVLVVGTSSGQQPVQAVAQQLTPTVSTDIRATVWLTNVAWGTKIDLECTHDADTKYPRGWYALTVTDRKGRVEQVASWSTVPELKTIKMAGSTGLPTDDIVAVDVRTATNKIILHLTR
ncbi:zf-HC2 domain-containing protein [Fodinicola feengrottensis]|uniref:Zf-HC2 domain-containing protein n=1 Tax=Fodinicola feengrottensis TaxID=435914 RepID=A0ABN2HCF0_9ACTN